MDPPDIRMSNKDPDTHRQSFYMRERSKYREPNCPTNLIDI